ncbi:MAG TPA: hypothetical protein VF109_00200 [Mycobacteriales bacterium]
MTRPSEASVVPIRITLDGRTGVTLWATPWDEDGEEWQAFLGAGSKVLVFGTADEVVDYLRSGAEHDLTDHPRHRDLLRLRPADLEPDEDYTFDFDGAYDLAASDPDPYTVSELSDLLDLVQRIAECCDDGTLLKLVEETPEFAQLLSDDVSFTGADGEQRWTAVGAVIEQSWEPLLERFGNLVEWRGEPVMVEDLPELPDRDDEDEDDDVEIVDLDAEDGPSAEPARTPPAALVTGSTGPAEEVEDDPTEGGVYTIWEVAGILPLSVTLPSGTGFTLRTYNGEDDEPLFLGADLTVYLFRTAAGLAAFCAQDEEHDLSEMVTWPDIRDAEDLQVEPEPEEVYDLRAPGDDAVELVLELADYCELDGITGALTRRRSGDLPFDTWAAAIDELETCIRWYD